MAEKKSVYISDELAAVIGNLPDNAPPSLSGRLNAIGIRYGEIIARALPDTLARFTADELNMIKIVMWTTETLTSPPGLLLGGLAHNLADSQDFELQDYPREAVDACIQKALALTPAEELALVEWIEGVKHGTGAASGLQD
ncbi:hypothetical protein CEK28_08515 [Xenophilus sp. AP218F]|nr:hypothetical protein CEK28_08515 [Xenophilus sp. AP218F]